MLKWILLAVVIFAGYRWYKMSNPQYAGMVASGWGGGNAGFNLPGVFNLKAIVAGPTAVGGVAFAPPGVAYGPSSNTNNGSAGG